MSKIFANLGYFLGASADELVCSAKNPGNAELWSINMALFTFFTFALSLSRFHFNTFSLSHFHFYTFTFTLSHSNFHIQIHTFTFKLSLVWSLTAPPLIL